MWVLPVLYFPLEPTEEEREEKSGWGYTEGEKRRRTGGEDAGDVAGKVRGGKKVRRDRKCRRRQR